LALLIDIFSNKAIPKLFKIYPNAKLDELLFFINFYPKITERRKEAFL